MDYDSSTKFISSLAKFLQSLCNGYVEFDNGVEVIGHIYLSVDTGKKIDYILNEKVCKTDENSVTFISNSFHAQPAEKPKPSSKRHKPDPNESIKSPDDRNVVDNGNVNEVEPRSTNHGTIPRSHMGQGQGNKGSSVSAQKQLKRPLSPNKGGHSSPGHKKNRTETHDQNLLDNNSVISTSSPAAETEAGVLHSAQGSDGTTEGDYPETYPETFFHPGEEESLAEDTEERDIKPSIDTDVTFVKEEFAPSCSQMGGSDSDRTRDDSSMYSGLYHSNQPYSSMSGFSNQTTFGAHNSQRLNYGATGDRSDMFDSGQGPHIEGVEGSADPSVLPEMVQLEEMHPLNLHDENLVRNLCGIGPKHGKDPDYKRPSPKWTDRARKFTCHFCWKSFVVKRDWEGHVNSIHLRVKPFSCDNCSWSSSHRGELQKHVKKCMLFQEQKAKQT